MSIQETLKRQIAELEKRITTEKGDVEALKRELARIQVQEFEEDLREEGNRQLLKG